MYTLQKAVGAAPVAAEKIEDSGAHKDKERDNETCIASYVPPDRWCLWLDVNVPAFSLERYCGVPDAAAVIGFGRNN